jgi:hypothetical protein
MRKTTAGITILLISIILAFSSAIYRSQNAFKCNYDGLRIIPVYEVDIRLKDGNTGRFCSVHCAKAWLQRNTSPVDSVIVTDEIAGERLDSAVAFFVESDVVTIKVAQNRIHSFRDKSDAMSHAKQYNGRLVENPFKSVNLKYRKRSR